MTVSNPLDPAVGALRPEQIDTARPSPARMYDYFLGGRDNYAVDREAAEHALAVFPQIRPAALANRAFLARAVRHLAALGVEQFLDIGAGIPSPGSTGEIAHEVNPSARVVYVDNDPVVLTHGRALLDRPGPGRCAVIPGDVREPEGFLGAPLLHEILDLSRPVAVLMVALLHFVGDEHDPFGVVRRVMDAVAPGSYLVLSHIAPDKETLAITEAAEAYRNATTRGPARPPQVIERFFRGLRILPPGLVPQPWWRPDAPVTADPDRNWLYAAVAQKPTP